MNKILFVISLLFISACGEETYADISKTVETHYTIGIKESGPFAHKTDGEWKGINIEIINNLSKKLQFTYDFVESKNITELLTSLKNGTVDMSMGAISITPERERTFDFSQSYFNDSQGILTLESDSVIWFIIQRIILVFFALIGIIYIFGYIVSKLDPNDAIDNIHKGAWFILVTYTTTGYGDFVPQNAKAKVFAAFVMLISMFLLAGFTSYVTATLTINQLSTTPVTISDLSSKRAKVIAVGGSTTDILLSNIGVNHKTVKTVDEGVNFIKNKKATAFVYDKALLDFCIRTEDNMNLIVHPLDYGVEQYAIVFPSKSELRESINIAMLELVQSPEWKQITNRYFGN